MTMVLFFVTTWGYALWISCIANPQKERKVCDV